MVTGDNLQPDALKVKRKSIRTISPAKNSRANGSCDHEVSFTFQNALKEGTHPVIVRDVFYDCLLIASDLQAYLARHDVFDLWVHSVFDTSVNLLTKDGELVTLASSSRDIMPMGLVAAVPSSVVWGLEPGDTVSYDGEMGFHLPRQAGSVLLTQAHVRSVSLDVSLYTGIDYSRRVLDMIKKKLLATDVSGISPLIARLPIVDTLASFCTENVYCTYIYRDLKLFLHMLADNDFEQAGEMTKKLLGFGPGLTPSCDDFLAGVMLSLFYNSRLGVDENTRLKDFFNRVIAMARDRTTLVSYYMLRHAACGKATEAYLELFAAVVEGDLTNLDSLIERVLAQGGSSGADFLFGLYSAQILSANSLKQPERSGRSSFEYAFVKE